MTGLISGGAALVGGLVTAGVGAYEASQQHGLQEDALGMAAHTQQEQDYYNSLLQTLIANPSSVSTLPGFQFQFDTGSKAVAARMGAGGFAGSGNEAAALTEFGQGLAGSFYGQQASLLASLSGVTAPSSPAQNVNAATGASSLTSNTLSSLLNSLGFYANLGRTYGAPAGTPAAIAGPQSPGTTTTFDTGGGAGGSLGG